MSVTTYKVMFVSQLDLVLIYSHKQFLKKSSPFVHLMWPPVSTQQFSIMVVGADVFRLMFKIIKMSPSLLLLPKPHMQKCDLLFLPTSSSSCLVSHETCLLDQVLELIMNEKPPNSASLFLNEDADKPTLPESGDLRRRLRRAMEKRANSMKERMSSISRDSVKGFFKRNLFVLFTVAAVALGEWRGKPSGGLTLLPLPSVDFVYICAFVCMCPNVFRCNPGLCPTSPQPVPEGDQVLCLSWGAPNENATDAGAASHRLQSGHRLAYNEHRRTNTLNVAGMFQ